jgi:uncharacterized protein YoxC
LIATTHVPPLVSGLFQVAARQDTLVVVSAGDRGALWWVGILADVATIFIAIALIAMALALIAAAWNSRKIYAAMRRLTDRLYDDSQPIVQHARDVADNVNYISASVRADVEELRATLHTTQASLLQAADHAERKIGEFNALLGVVQEEAERIFIDTASTLRGVSAGANTLREPSAQSRETKPGKVEIVRQSPPGDPRDQ